MSRLGEIQADDGKVRNAALNLTTIAEAVVPLLYSGPVQAVNAAGDTKITAINTAGSTQVSAVNAAGSTQLAALNAVINSAYSITAQGAATTATQQAGLAYGYKVDAQAYANLALGYKNESLNFKNDANTYKSLAYSSANDAIVAKNSAISYANIAASEASSANAYSQDAEISKSGALDAKAQAQAAAEQANASAVAAGSYSSQAQSAAASFNLSIGQVYSGPVSGATVYGTAPNYILDLTLEPGSVGPAGQQGQTGLTGQTGQAGPTGQTGAGVASGGSTGQALVKASNSSYDTAWTTLVLGDRYLTTSTTSLTIDNGNKTLTVSTGLAYTTQQDIVIAYNASHHMHCLVTSYNPATGELIVDVQTHTGSGTYSSWTVNVGGTTTAVLPIGGTTSQILQKSSATDFDVSWTTAYSGSDALKTANNLSELTATASTVRTNLGLGTMATQTAASYALLAGPTFTGVPAAPTAAASTSTTQLATTAFVTTADNLKANLASPTFTGTVTIPAGASISGYALLASPTFTGTTLAPTATAGTNTTQVATTAFVTTAVSGKANTASPTFTGTVTIPAGASISGYQTTSSAASTYAPLASPTFTGTVTIPSGALITGYLTSASASSTYQTQAGMSSYITSSTAASTYQTQTGMSSYLTTASAASSYYSISNPSGFITSSALSGYLTDAPSNGSEYVRKDGAWSVATGGGGGGGGGSYLPLAGGAMDVNADITLYDGSTYDSELSGWGLGVEMSSDHNQATTVEYNGLHTYNNNSVAKSVSVTPDGISFSGSTNQNTPWLDAPSDGDQYVRKDGAWEVNAGPVGSVSWGSINGYIVDQTDLGSVLSAKYDASNPSSYQTSGDVSTYVSGLGYTTRKQAIVNSVRMALNDSAAGFDGGGYYFIPLNGGTLASSVTNGDFSSVGKWFGMWDYVGGMSVTPVISVSVSSGTVTITFSTTSAPSYPRGLFYTEDGGSTWVESTFTI
jgi:hypothetical protein